MAPLPAAAPVTGLPSEPIGGHALERLTVRRTPENAFLVAVVCLCGRTMHDIPVADFSGIFHVAIQAFLAHLAAVALPSVE
jgi:hypothetical protein